jgi:hypothetical protein
MAGRFTLSSSYVAPGWGITVTTWDYGLQIIDGVVRQVNVRWFNSSGSLVPPYMMPNGLNSSTQIPSGSTRVIGAIAGKGPLSNPYLTAITTTTTGSAGEPLVHMLNRAVKTYVSATYPGVKI